MRTETKNYVLGMLVCIAIVAGFSFLGSVAQADSPTKADYDMLAQVKTNQKVLTKTRDAFNQFTAAKADNEHQISALAKDGWTVDWNSMTLVRSFQ